MTTEIIFLRHAETQVEYGEVPSKWNLSRRGKEHAVKLAVSGVFKDVDVIISSEETKAFQTACPIAVVAKTPVERNFLFNELNRDGGFIMTTEDYREAVHAVLVDLDHQVYGWEASGTAFRRFRRGLEDVLTEHESERILIISHGIVLSYHFARILDVPLDAPSRWDALEFCAYGLVRDNEVIKDLI